MPRSFATVVGSALFPGLSSSVSMHSHSPSAPITPSNKPLSTVTCQTVRVREMKDLSEGTSMKPWIIQLKINWHYSRSNYNVTWHAIVIEYLDFQNLNDSLNTHTFPYLLHTSTKFCCCLPLWAFFVASTATWCARRADAKSSLTPSSL